MSTKVFISHSSNDKTLADRLCNALENSGISCWIAPRNILSGMAWGEAIVKGILNSQLLLLLLSQDANISRHVAREVERADTYGKHLLPVRIEDVQPSDELSYFIGNTQWFDCFKDDFDVKIGLLVDRVRSLLNLSPHDDVTKRHFWNELDQGGITIIMERFLQFREFEASGLIGYGGSMALADLRAYLGTCNIQNYSIALADNVHPDLLKSNLILLGGPDANRISRSFMEKIKSGLRFGNPDRYEIAVHDLVKQKTYAPRLLKPGNNDLVGIDYGLIIFAANPFDERKKALFIAGSFGYGTWAGVRYATCYEFFQHELIASKQHFECLVETSVVRETPVEITMKVMRALSPQI